MVLFTREVLCLVDKSNTVECTHPVGIFARPHCPFSASSQLCEGLLFILPMIASQHKGVSQRCAGSQRLSRPARVSRVCKAVEGQYNHIVPNFDYINAVLDAFPEDAVANPDEARVRSWPSRGDHSVSLLHCAATCSVC